MFRGALPTVILAALCAACGSSKPGTPPTPSPPGGSGGESITGRERLGWDQPAPNTAELATFRYAIYVDNARSELVDVSCSTTPGANGYACLARLPAMSNGTHVLELAAFVDAGGVVESPRSTQLRVTVTASTAPDSALSPLADGEVLTTTDGLRLRVERILDGLDRPGAIAVAPDGRVFIGTAAGLIIVRDGLAIASPQLPDGRVLALAFSPDAAKDGYLFLTQAVPARSGRLAFRTSRFRDLGDRLVERMVILEHGAGSADPHAAVRFGPDRKLYLAFDSGGNAAAAERMSEWSGKILRMEPDGRTPGDQAAASPVLWRGLTSPRGFDWSADGSSLWIVDTAADGAERLRLIVPTSDRPRRAAQSASYMLPPGLRATALSVYRGEAIGALAGDALIAGAAGYILRLSFDVNDKSRPVRTERLLENRVPGVQALAIGPDGAIYFCTDSQLVRLTAAR